MGGSIKQGRVALISRYPPYGKTHEGRGIGSYCKLLANALSELGLEVIILADRIGDEVEVYEEGNLAVWRVWRPGFRAVNDVVNAVADLRPETIHFQHELFVLGAGPAVLAPARMLAELKKHAHVVTTVHGIVPVADFTPQFTAAYAKHLPPAVVRPTYARIVRSIAKHSHRLIAHNDAVAKAFGEYAPNAPIEVIQHGTSEVSAKPAREEGLATLGLKDTKRAVFFGYLLPYKGVDLLEAAAPELAKHGVSVLVAGGHSGDEKPTHTKPIVLEGVERMGFVPEDLIPSLFAISDVLVLPYRVGLSASGPLCLASSYGVPVCVSDVPTLADVVQESRAIFRRDDVGHLVQRVLDVIGDQQLQRSVVKRLESNAEATSWPTVAAETAELYKTLNARV